MSPEDTSVNNPYIEFLPPKLRRSHEEVRLTGRIKTWSSGINDFFQEHAPEADELAITLTTDQFRDLPPESRELIHDLGLTEESHPTIRLHKPNDDKGFALSIDPQNYIQDGNAGITLTTGYSGTQSGVHYVNFTGQLLDSLSTGYTQDFGSTIIDKYFHPGDPKDHYAGYAEATTEFIFLHKKRIALLESILPWIKNEYLRREQITYETPSSSSTDAPLDTKEILDEITQHLAGSASQPPNNTATATINAAEELLKLSRDSSSSLSAHERETALISDRQIERDELRTERERLMDEANQWETFSPFEKESLMQLISLINARLDFQQEDPSRLPITVRHQYSPTTTDEFRFCILSGIETETSKMSVAVVAEDFHSTETQANEFSRVYLNWIDIKAGKRGIIRLENIIDRDSKKSIFLAEENPDKIEKYFETDIERWKNGHGVGFRETLDRQMSGTSYDSLSPDSFIAILKVLLEGDPDPELMQKGTQFLVGHNPSKTIIPTKSPLGAAFRLPGDLQIDI
jgi:hypothetical protein